MGGLENQEEDKNIQVGVLQESQPTAEGNTRISEGKCNRVTQLRQELCVTQGCSWR